MTPRSSRQDATTAIDDFHPGHCTHNRAVRLSWLSRSDLVLWPEASVRCVAAIRPELGVKPTCQDSSTDAIDPSEALCLGPRRTEVARKADRLQCRRFRFRTHQAKRVTTPMGAPTKIVKKSVRVCATATSTISLARGDIRHWLSSR